MRDSLLCTRLDRNFIDSNFEVSLLLCFFVVVVVVVAQVRVVNA